MAIKSSFDIAFQPSIIPTFQPSNAPTLQIVILSGVEASILKVAISCLPLEGESKRECILFEPVFASSFVSAQDDVDQNDSLKVT
jgi:hypothetical protein